MVTPVPRSLVFDQRPRAVAVAVDYGADAAKAVALLAGDFAGGVDCLHLLAGRVIAAVAGGVALVGTLGAT